MVTSEMTAMRGTTGRARPGHDPFATTIAPPSGRTTQRPPSKLDAGLARGLGWFSIGLGLTQLLFPDALARLIGVKERPLLLRLCGARELFSGIGILSRRRPAAALWSRVIGDGADLALLGAALNAPGNDVGRVTVSTAAVLGVTALDVVAATRMTVQPPSLRTLRVVKSVAINRSPMECYALWRNLENLPAFMGQLQSVRTRDERRSHWVVRGPAGKEVEWDAEITRDEPGTLIAWRSTGGDVETHGAVEFAPRPNGRGTLLRVSMEYSPPAGAVGSIVAKLFLVAPEQQVREDLRRFKQLMETGELATTQGQPHCARSLGYRALARYLTGGES